MARPRGWLIALAHGSFVRSIAFVQAGRIHDAEADARLSFDYKLSISPPPALIWSLSPLVDALTEMGALADADAALAAAGHSATRRPALGISDAAREPSPAPPRPRSPWRRSS